MPLHSSDCSTCGGGEPCCDDFYALTKGLVDIAHTAAESCLCDDCDDLEAFVHHQEPPGPGEWVAGWISLITPKLAGDRFKVMPRLIVNVNVAVQLEGWPGIETSGGRIGMVDRHRWSVASRIDYSVANIITKALLQETVKGSYSGCLGVALNSVLPQPVGSKWARWTWSFNAEFQS